jgi:hypothetical protein
MEETMCRSLKFNLNPPTYYMWANRLMMQYDEYLKQSEVGLNHPLFRKVEKFFFREYDDGSYVNFRVLMQYIDCAILNIETVQYTHHLLVLSFMYLYIGTFFTYFRV